MYVAAACQNRTMPEAWDKYLLLERAGHNNAVEIQYTYTLLELCTVHIHVYPASSYIPSMH